MDKKVDTLTPVEAKDFVLTTRGYTLSPFPRRIHSLDRVCDDQRLMQIWFNNANSNLRKRSLVETFNHWRKEGYDRAFSYKKACQTQVTDLQRIKCLNVDARTTYSFTDS
jgi:hypothetical protein